MGKKCNKVEQTCGTTTFSACSIFEGTPNTQSLLHETECLNQEEISQDLYDQLEDVLNETDLSELGQNCLTYVLDEGQIVVKNVLLKLEETICAQKQTIEDLQNRGICDMKISGCGLNYEGLVDSCGNQPQTLGDLLQILIDK